MRGVEIVRLAEEFDWKDEGPGGEHPFMLNKKGAKRRVPVRNKVKGRIEAQVILKELGIPRNRWPEKCR